MTLSFSAELRPVVAPGIELASLRVGDKYNDLPIGPQTATFGKEPSLDIYVLGKQKGGIDGKISRAPLANDGAFSYEQMVLVLSDYYGREKVEDLYSQNDIHLIGLISRGLLDSLDRETQALLKATSMDKWGTTLELRPVLLPSVAAQVVNRDERLEVYEGNIGGYYDTLVDTGYASRKEVYPYREAARQAFGQVEDMDELAFMDSLVRNHFSDDRDPDVEDLFRKILLLES